MHVVTVVGARPQFIKAAAVSAALRVSHKETLVHTGQHYDPDMSDVFFEELGIPAPDYHLGVGSGPHGAQTGQMLAWIEDVLLKERPDWVVVYGDTNSTLAGALAAAKLHVPVAHVEAGLRSFNRAMPEELNRVLTDHLSSLLLCPTGTAVSNLGHEGIVEGVRLVGDVMYDALQAAMERARASSTILERLAVTPGDYCLATVHRAENTDHWDRLANILEGLGSLGTTVLLPLHPRTRAAIHRAGLSMPESVRILAPLGYLDMCRLLEAAKVVLTDSGGLQKEALWLGTLCVTLRDETEWVETVASGWNQLAGADPALIREAAGRAAPTSIPESFANDRGAAARCVEALGYAKRVRASSRPRPR